MVAFRRRGEGRRKLREENKREKECCNPNLGYIATDQRLAHDRVSNVCDNRVLSDITISLNLVTHMTLAAKHVTVLRLTIYVPTRSPNLRWEQSAANHGH